MKRSIRVQSTLALGSLLIIAQTLAGQSATVDPATPRAPQTETADSGIKSSGTGVALSIGGIVVPMVAAAVLQSNHRLNGAGALVGFVGFLIGPTFGHLYAGQGGRALGGVGMRLLATVGAAAAVGATWNSSSSTADGVGVLVIGVAAASVIGDIARVPGSVRRYNATAHPTGPTLEVTPIVTPSRLGIGARVTF